MSTDVSEIGLRWFDCVMLVFVFVAVQKLATVIDLWTKAFVNRVGSRSVRHALLQMLVRRSLEIIWLFLMTALIVGVSTKRARGLRMLRDGADVPVMSVIALATSCWRWYGEISDWFVDFARALRERRQDTSSSTHQQSNSTAAATITPQSTANQQIPMASQGIVNPSASANPQVITISRSPVSSTATPLPATAQAPSANQAASST
ncbi:hypothetical protein BDV19DRAFT_314070 [Aspergillus venezuelensis]